MTQLSRSAHTGRASVDLGGGKAAIAYRTREGGFERIATCKAAHYESLSAARPSALFGAMERYGRYLRPIPDHTRLATADA